MNIKFYKIFIFSIIIFLSCNLLYSQTDYCWTLFVKKKGVELFENKNNLIDTIKTNKPGRIGHARRNSDTLQDNMCHYSENGFYLLKNYLYEYRLDDGYNYFGRIIEIKKDSLYISTLRFYDNFLKNFYNQKYDTLKISINQFNRILIPKKIYNYEPMYRDSPDLIIIDSSDYNYTFIKQNKHCGYEPEKQKIYRDCDSTYEIYPYLTAHGIKRIYEDNGEAFSFQGITRKPKPRIIDSNYLWLPVCIIPTGDIPVDRINGLALGFMAMPGNKKNSLEINGLSIECFSWISPYMLLYGGFTRSDSDVFAEFPHKVNTRINGINLSLFGSTNNWEGLSINGFYIGGIYTNVNRLTGLSITGINTITSVFQGVCISGLRNQAKYGRGVQIGMINSCLDFKGIQIGLWNSNNRGSLPFINWNF